MPSILFSRQQPAATVQEFLRTATEARRHSTSTASLIACVVSMLFLFWACTLLWIYRYSQLHPRPLNKVLSLRIQRFAPACYFIVVVNSIIAVAISLWLVLQLEFTGSPNHSILTRNAIRFFLFTSLWTSLFGGVFTTLLLHPTWSTHTVCSVGFQAVWTAITTIFWLAGIATLAAGVGAAFAKCPTLVYCHQLRALLGLATIELIVLVFGAGFFIRLGWQVVEEQRATIAHPTEPEKV